MQKILAPHMDWSLKKGKIHEKLAIIMLVLLYKRDNPALPKNFRPVGVAESYISLLDNYVQELLNICIMSKSLLSDSIKGVNKKEDGLRDSIFLTMNTLKEAHSKKKRISNSNFGYGEIL
jgi:hypothetical protein